MSQSKDFVNPKHPHKVCKLLKSIYGLKQSPQMWFEKYNKYLIHQGFVPSSTPSNVYVKKIPSKIIILGLCVDDQILVSNDLNFLVTIKQEFSSSFKMMDNDELEYCLGIQVKCDRASRKITLTQSKYISNILQWFNILQCKPTHRHSSHSWLSPHKPHVSYYNS